MILASSLDVLFDGPSPAIVAGILVVASVAAVAVFWSLVRLIVDPRPTRPDQPAEPRRLTWDEAADPVYDDTFAVTRGDGTG